MSKSYTPDGLASASPAQQSFFSEMKWFVAVGFFLALAALSGGMRFWASEERLRLLNSRGPTFSHSDRTVVFARDYTREEFKRVHWLQVQSLLGAVGVAIGVVGTIGAAVGLWIVRSVNRRRMEEFFGGKQNSGEHRQDIAQV